MNAALTAVALAAFMFSAQGSATDPIGKVVQMLSDLEGKIIGEGEAAQKTYSEFAEWCEDRSKNFRFEIKTAKAEVEDLKAAIEKSASDIENADTKVEDLKAAIEKS